MCEPMTKETNTYSDMKEDEKSTNYKEENSMNQNTNKKIIQSFQLDDKNESKYDTEINISNLNNSKDKQNNYLKNLELYKNLPDSMITNIMQSKKFITQNHNILFSHYSKDKDSKSNSESIQSIVISTNLKSSTIKDNNSSNTNSNRIRSLSNNSKLIYHKKSLQKAKSINNSNNNNKVNSNKYHKKNNNTSQSTINANSDTNYDYDCENNITNNTNTNLTNNPNINSNSNSITNNNNIFNYINFTNNSDKLNLLEKQNNFTDISLKEFLSNETKSIRTMIIYSENKPNNENNNIDKEIKTENKDNNNEDKSIQVIQSLNLKINTNPDIKPYAYADKQKTGREDITINNQKEKKNAYDFSNNKTNINSNKIRPKTKSFDNKGDKSHSSYVNKYKAKKYKVKIGNQYHQLLSGKSFSFLSSTGNFVTKPKRISLNEEEKNGKKKSNNNKLNIFINTQNFYNDSKIDYTSFRKKTLYSSNMNNPRTTKNLNRNVFKHKEEKRAPCKLIKKELINTNTPQMASLINSIRVKSKSKSKSTRNMSESGGSTAGGNLLYEKNKKIISNNIKRENYDTYNSITSKLLLKKNNSEEKSDKSDKDKKKIFQFKKRENKRQKQKNECDKSGPLFTVKIDYNDLVNDKNNQFVITKEN